MSQGRHPAGPAACLSRYRSRWRCYLLPVVDLCGVLLAGVLDVAFAATLFICVLFAGALFALLVLVLPLVALLLFALGIRSPPSLVGATIVPPRAGTVQKIRSRQNARTSANPVAALLGPSAPIPTPHLGVPRSEPETRVELSARVE